MLSTKTQFAGMGVRMLVIKLFKYISKKYFRDFDLIDEGLYWESENEETLKERFREHNGLFDKVSYSLENFPTKDDETLEMYFERVLIYKTEKS